jgi:hypothetical protein
VRLAFHLGPEVHVELDGTHATLQWRGSTAGAAQLELPAELRWTLHRGQTDPILGWYSCGLGQRTPAFTLLGCGRSAPDVPLTSRLEFAGAGQIEELSAARAIGSRSPSGLPVAQAQEIRAEAG